MLIFENGTIVDGKGNVTFKGDIWIEKKKIKKIGDFDERPENAEIIDCSGKYITPGLIDVHTHLGVHEEGVGAEGHDFNETSDPITPEVRALDGINPFEKGFEDARQAGVTTVQVLPGSANVIGGEMVTLKTTGTIVDDMILRNPSGMKAAFGENPKRLHGTKGKAPITRMGVASLFRSTLKKAQSYAARTDKQEVDLGMEQLVKVLHKEIPIRAHAHRADDIVTLIRLAKEFDIDISIEHCTEGHLIADYVGAQGVHASIGPTMSTRAKIELANKGWETSAVLVKEGVPISITTDHPVVGIDQLISSAIHAVKYGLEEQEAWKAITSTASEHLGVDHRVGSLEEGKDADVVVWSGDPFDMRSYVEATYIDGMCVYKKKTEHE